MEAIRDIKLQIMDQLETKNLSFGTKSSGFDDLTLVEGDVNRFRRVLLVMVENAHQFSKRDGNIVVEATFQELAEPHLGFNAKLKMAVVDNGHGMTSEKVQELIRGLEVQNFEMGTSLLVAKTILE